MRLSKADLEILTRADSIVTADLNFLPDVKALSQWQKLVAKLTRDKDAGVSAGNIEQAMLAQSRGKLVKLVTGPSYAAASKMATRQGVTVEDAAIVGKWLACQGWLSQQTLLDVLRKWDTWLPKARALFGDEKGKNGDDTRQGAAKTGPPPTVRRKAGFGG